jgi:general secretion pathway protein A
MYNQHFGFSDSPFNVTPDSRFFFVNPCYEEAFATLRYGIDARKGFIAVSGEAGTGKTTVLKRLIYSLESHVHTTCIFDPHLSFTELLHGMLRDLGLTPAGRDRLSMMRQLYDFLIERLENGHIVALLIDEAQSLSVAMLEELRLLSNLETDTEKLIQIILIGQPGFEEKLDRPELIQLKQRVALRCRIRPLDEPEVGSYIQSRLKTVNYTRGDLFDRECIERIARYSKGIPRLINVICDNALLIACAAGRRWVAADDVSQAARELQLVDPGEAPINADARWAPRRGREEVFRPAWERPAREEPQLRPEFEPVFADIGERAGFWQSAPESRTRGFGALLILLITGGMLVVMAARQNPMTLETLEAYFANWTNIIHVDKAAAPPLPAQAPPAPVAPQPAPVIVPEHPGRLIETLTDDFVAGDEHGKAAGFDTPVHATEQAPSKSPAPIARNKRPSLKRAPLASVRNDAAFSVRTMEIEVYKAIRDRAITGVHVASIDDGTVHLEGRVATTRQKLAAVRAALSVPGVKNVRDRIVIR